MVLAGKLAGDKKVLCWKMEGEQRANGTSDNGRQQLENLLGNMSENMPERDSVMPQLLSGSWIALTNQYETFQHSLSSFTHFPRKLPRRSSIPKLLKAKHD